MSEEKKKREIGKIGSIHNFEVECLDCFAKFLVNGKFDEIKHHVCKDCKTVNEVIIKWDETLKRYVAHVKSFS